MFDYYPLIQYRHFGISNFLILVVLRQAYFVIGYSMLHFPVDFPDCDNSVAVFHWFV